MRPRLSTEKRAETLSPPPHPHPKREISARAPSAVGSCLAALRHPHIDAQRACKIAAWI